MFSEASVSHSVHGGGGLPREGGLHPGGFAWGGVCLQKGLLQGGLHPVGLPTGGLHPVGLPTGGRPTRGGSASRGVGSASNGRGLHQGGLSNPHSDILWWPLQESIRILLECFLVGN